MLLQIHKMDLPAGEKWQLERKIFSSSFGSLPRQQTPILGRSILRNVCYHFVSMFFLNLLISEEPGHAGKSYDMNVRQTMRVRICVGVAEGGCLGKYIANKRKRRKRMSCHSSDNNKNNN